MVVRILYQYMLNILKIGNIKRRQGFYSCLLFYFCIYFNKYSFKGTYINE